jgi:sugar phosphate isomerase/epimerase
MKYQGEVFVSTGAFGRMDVEDMLAIASSEGIRHVELSSGASHRSMDLASALLQAQGEDNHYLVHNYFPVPSRPFVLNLASNDPQMLELSRDHCRKAIDLAAMLGAPFYSVHAGFCIHLKPEDLGRQLKGEQISKPQAWQIFLQSVRELGEYALSKNVLLAIENNVAAPHNLREGRNDLLLGVTGEDLKELMEAVSMESVRLLLDVAHLKVSATSLAFDASAAVEMIAPWIIACHLSDNDGTADTNDVLTQESWCWKPLSQYLKAAPSWVIEVYDISPEVMKQQVKLVKELMAAHNPVLVA